MPRKVASQQIPLMTFAEKTPPTDPTFGCINSKFMAALHCVAESRVDQAPHRGELLSSVLFYLSAFGICVFLVYGSSGRISRTVSKLATRLRTHSPASQQMTEYKTSSARMSPRANKSPLPPRPTRSPFNSSNDDVYNRDSAL